MLCFNYIANIIKLMGLLSREGMRDGNIGICWDAGHIGICGICGTDHLPEIGPAGLPFLVPPPPACKGWRQERQTINEPKKNAYFVFRSLIINHINQYFNIHLHLIRFITYNRRIFIAKYFLSDKICSIFALVR